MENVVVRAEKEKILKLFQAGIEIIKQKSLCKSCFSLVIRNKVMFLELSDDIILNGERIYINGKISDGIPVVIESPKDKIEICWIGLQSLEEYLKDIQRCSDIIELKFDALESDGIFLGVKPHIVSAKS